MGVDAAILGSAALGAGSSMAASSKAEKMGKKNLQSAKAAAAQIDERLRPTLALGELYNRKSASAMTGGFDQAGSQIARGEQAGLRSLSDMRRQAGAAAGQSMTNRGLSGTTIGQQAAQGAERAYSRDLADFQTQVGGMYADLARQRAMAQSGAYDKMAQFQAFKGNALQAGPQALIGIANNTQFQAPGSPDLSGLGALLAMYGGKGGGLANSQLGSQIATNQTWQTFNSGSGFPGVSW